MNSNKLYISTLPDFDMASHLTSEKDIEVYLAMVTEDGDSAEVTHAFEVIARASCENDDAPLNKL